MNIFNHIGPDLRQLIVGAELDQHQINKGILCSKIIIDNFWVFFNNGVFPLLFFLILFSFFSSLFLLFFIITNRESDLFWICCFCFSFTYSAYILLVMILMIYKIISFNNLFKNNYNLIIDLTSSKRYMRILVNTVPVTLYVSHKDFFYIDLDVDYIESIELVKEYRFNFSILFFHFPVVFRDVLIIKIKDNYHISPVPTNLADLSRGIFFPLGRNRFKTTILLKYLLFNGKRFIVIPMPINRSLSYQQNISYLLNLLSNYFKVPVYFIDLKNV